MTLTTTQIEDLERRARTASTSLADSQRLSADAERLRGRQGGSARRPETHVVAMLRN